MAHPQGEASPAPATSGDPVEALADFLDGVKPEEEEQAETAEEESDEELEAEDTEDEGETEDSDTDDEPPEVIDPPVSLNKEQKAAFAQLPPELQKIWAETEVKRNQEVQLKTTEAAEAKRTAQAQARAEFAQYQRQYADELEIYADALKPQEPDYGLLATDPQAFAEQMAWYKQLSAQYENTMQRVQLARQQANQFDQQYQAEIAQREAAKLRAELPEWFDPAKQAEIQTALIEVGHELGYTDELMAQASAADILALKKAQAWKAKAEKYDALQSRKMANVRAAKALPKVSKPNVAPSRNDPARGADAAWQRAKATKSGDDYADYLSKIGVL